MTINKHVEMAWMNPSADNRKVVLLKSLATSNRFYTLVSSESGYHNADAIAKFPDDLILGIAYPCLEDGLNDFAVIRTTFETIDLFADDQGLRSEMMGIIHDARANLQHRLAELRDRIAVGQAHFLGTDLHEFKESLTHLVERGAIRRTLDNMMKVDVFEFVSEADAQQSRVSPDPMYRYEFAAGFSREETSGLTPRSFVSRLFDDLLVAVDDDGNYGSKYLFDRHVFQKFIAVMFINYATTDRMFHGTSREDYGVSGDREMDGTPLYQAVGAALRLLERGEEPGRSTDDGYAAAVGVPQQVDVDVESIFGVLPELAGLTDTPLETRRVELPAFGTEQRLSEPFAGIADALRLMETVEHPRIVDCRQLIGRATRQLFEVLKELGILPPMADNPIPAPRDQEERS
jgi:hypothetical protein